MIAQVTAAMLLALAPPQQADTTFAVDASGRLQITQIEGELRVSAWDRSEMRVVAEYDEDDARIEIRQSGGTVHVSAKGEWGEPVWAELDITIPRRMAIEVSGVTLPVTIEGTEADITVGTAEGDLELDGGSGNVALNVVEGMVSVEGATGNIVINAVDGDVSVSRARGVLSVTAVDGDVSLESIDSENVSVTSVDGDIGYRGTVVDGGRYVFSTHDGDLWITIPDGTNARVSVDTFSGELDADFPVEMEGDFGKKRISFTIGTGKALMELSAFDGTISLKQE